MNDQTKADIQQAIDRVQGGESFLQLGMEATEISPLDLAMFEARNPDLRFELKKLPATGDKVKLIVRRA